MTAFGLAGTTTADMQRIIASMYRNAGIVDGTDVTGTATMSYDIQAGAVVLDTGEDLAVLVPVPATNIPTDPAPATGSRTDTIYVKQNFLSGGDPDNLSFVGVTSGAAPTNSIVLDRRTVPAGATATTATTSIHNRKFALPIGGSLGTQFFETTTSGRHFTETVTRGAGEIFCPTDRDVDFRFLTTIVGVNEDGSVSDGANVGSVHYKLFIDGVHVRTFERAYDKWSETKQFSYLARLSEGEHTFHYTVGKASGSLWWQVQYGGPNKWPGDVLHVLDIGVSNA